jgi:hypothetical protein
MGFFGADVDLVQPEGRDGVSPANLGLITIRRCYNSYPKALLFVGNTDSALLNNLQVNVFISTATKQIQVTVVAP